MSRENKDFLNKIPKEMIAHLYRVSYRCGCKDFIKVFMLYINTTHSINDGEYEIQLSSFRDFCIKYREAEFQNNFTASKSVNISEEIRSRFEEIDFLEKNISMVNNDIRKLSGSSMEPKNSIKPSVKSALKKKMKLERAMKNSLNKIEKSINTTNYQLKGVESLFFVRYFISTEEALEYIKMKTVDSYMIKGSNKLFEDIAHRSIAETASPLMACYIYYKFQLLFSKEIKFI